MLAYVVVGLAFALVGIKFWLDERKELRCQKREELWYKLLTDLLNRKMARDFYDYVNGTEVLRKSENPIEKWEKEALAKMEELKQSPPPFINQYRPKVDVNV